MSTPVHVFGRPTALISPLFRSFPRKFNNTVPTQDEMELMNAGSGEITTPLPNTTTPQTNPTIYDTTTTQALSAIHTNVNEASPPQTQSNVSTTNPLRVFTTFNKLPPELRFKIWKMSLPGPRIVKAVFRSEDRQFRSSARIPAALHTSRESRQEALKCYKLTFGRPCFYNKSLRIDHRIYFDFEIDTFYPTTVDIGDLKGTKDVEVAKVDVRFLAAIISSVAGREKIKHGAINIMHWAGLFSTTSNLECCISSYFFGPAKLATEALWVIDLDHQSGRDLELLDVHNNKSGSQAAKLKSVGHRRP